MYKTLILICVMLISLSLPVWALDEDRLNILNNKNIYFKSENAKTISVAGDFNDWCGSASGNFNPEIGKMTKEDKGYWSFSLSGISKGPHHYKFIIDGAWERGQNRNLFIDEDGKIIDPTGGVKSVVLEDPETIKVTLSDLCQADKNLKTSNFKLLPKGHVDIVTKLSDKEYILHISDFVFNSIPELKIKGLSEKTIKRPILFDGLFQKAFISTKKLGAFTEGKPVRTVFRLFAPRAVKVCVKLFDDPEMQSLIHCLPAFKDVNGVWEASIDGTFYKKYYGFQVFGPVDKKQGFDSDVLWPDPYCKVSYYHQGPSILINTKAKSASFQGWTDHNFKTPDKKKLIIWEASVRDLTSDESSGVSAEHRGKYLGIVETLNKSSGIGHIKDLGVNAVELLPVYEFDDEPPGTYNWGYMPSLYFAPESSYAVNHTGDQLNEFKAMINAFHKAGIAVILDVVYNHTGAPQTLMGIDKQYFYRHDGNMNLYNYSGCGNDFKSENPMCRRLILDSLKYWVSECHIDGFRFDLAELIDHKTLININNELTKLKPDIVLIAEPWSSRGNIKGDLKNTAWASWNDGFRNTIKNSCMNKIDAKEMAPYIKGTVELWAANPGESVNYVESHDNYTLTDYLSRNKKKDGHKPTKTEIKENLLCAAITLLSPGVPMLAGGQEMLRSKLGNENSYNAGDKINSIKYGLKKENSEVYNIYKKLVHLRISKALEPIRESSAAYCKQAEVISPNKNTLAIIFKDKTSKIKNILVLINTNHSKNEKVSTNIKNGKWKNLISINNKSTNLSTKLVNNKKTEFTLRPLSFELWQMTK